MTHGRLIPIHLCGRSSYAKGTATDGELRIEQAHGKILGTLISLGVSECIIILETSLNTENRLTLGF